jgi:spermidine/putrescine transport system permease protein
VRGLLALPIGAYFVAFCLIPLATLLLTSFWTDASIGIEHTFTLDNYKALVVGDTASTFLIVLRKTLTLALIVTALALAIGYPTAYYLARASSARLRAVGFVLLFVPLFTSYLVKIYAWRGLLGDRGILNYSLIELGLIEEPLGFLLFNQFAVGLALLSAVLPFMILPLYTALERVPASLIEAASDLGAGRRFTLLHVLVPLTRRGIVSGCTFVFVICFGDFVASQLLGGTSGILVGRLIFTDFGLADDWPAGSAMAWVVLLVATVIVLSLAWVARAGHDTDVALDSQLTR